MRPARFGPASKSKETVIHVHLKDGELLRAEFHFVRSHSVTTKGVEGIAPNRDLLYRNVSPYDNVVAKPGDIAIYLGVLTTVDRHRGGFLEQYRVYSVFMNGRRWAVDGLGGFRVSKK